MFNKTFVFVIVIVIVIKGFKLDVWNTKRHDLMLQLVQAKFQQNPNLADELRNTGKKNNFRIWEA